MVGFVEARHNEGPGHSYDVKTSKDKYARSYDGGLNWFIEDAYGRGQTAWRFNNANRKHYEKPDKLTERINFTHPDLALTFLRQTNREGSSHFYYSYNRGMSWKGPHEFTIDFPDLEPAGIVTRTDYIIEGKHELTAFLTVGFIDGDEDWRKVACVRTNDGGKTWRFLSWIEPDGDHLIMPSSVRLGPSKILTLVRRTEPPEMASYISDDNGYSWIKRDNPPRVDGKGHPPALLKLQDGRLLLLYGIRRNETKPEGIGIYAKTSSDEGKTWSKATQIRGGDGAIWDIGYPQMVQRPDGKIVAVYYYNNAGNKDKTDYRYIAATLFDPNKLD